MNQEQNTQNVTPPTNKQRRWLLPAIIAGVVIIVAGGALTFFLLRQPTEKSQTLAPAEQPKSFSMTASDTAVTYAGNPVYDACGMISFDTIRSTVNSYQTLLDMNGTDQKPTEPLTIEHRYIDRDIPAPLDKDGEPRPTGTKIGESGTDATVFVSDNDSNCWYGQGTNLSLGIGKTFAKVYITQKPTPLSGDLINYLRSLNKAGEEGDIAAYVEPKTDSGGFFTGIITDEKKGVVVFIKAASQELASKATTEASNKLAGSPKGPVNLTYPDGWSKMPNPCALLTAEDFLQATGKPARAIAEDTMGLNEIGGRLMQRSCERLEVGRLDGTPIAKSNITVRMGRDEASAKAYVDTLKNNANDTFDIQPLKQKIAVADDAYIKVIKDGDTAKGYEFDMRIGQAVIVLAIDTDQGLDQSADAFAARMLSTARSVASHYMKE